MRESRKRPAASSLAHGIAGRDVRRTEAQRFKTFFGSALGVMRGPAGSVLKKPNGANPFFLAQIEPVPGSARHTQQIARLDRDRDDVSFARMNMKQATAFNNEAHFIFIVPVFTVEAIQHGIESWRSWQHIDHVSGDVAAFR